MKEIDFIPEWYKANQNRRKRYHRQYVLLGFLLVILMVWSFVVGQYVKRVHADVEDIQSVFEKGELKVNQAMSLESDIALLQQQVQLLEATTPRTNISPILAELSWLIGDNIVLSKLSLKNEIIERSKEQASAPSGLVQIGASQEKKTVSAGPTRTKITLIGIAAKGADAADLISRLEESAYFEQVLPVFTRGKKVGDCDVTEFEIRAYVADYEIQE